MGHSGQRPSRRWLVGRDVVLNVPDHFGGIGVRAVEADAAHEERSRPGDSSDARREEKKWDTQDSVPPSIGAGAFGCSKHVASSECPAPSVKSVAKVFKSRQSSAVEISGKNHSPGDIASLAGPTPDRREKTRRHERMFRPVARRPCYLPRNGAEPGRCVAGRPQQRLERSKIEGCWTTAQPGKRSGCGSRSTASCRWSLHLSRPPRHGVSSSGSTRHLCQRRGLRLANNRPGRTARRGKRRWENRFHSFRAGEVDQLAHRKNPAAVE